jgi:hypothetical protein
VVGLENVNGVVLKVVEKIVMGLIVKCVKERGDVMNLQQQGIAVVEMGRFKPKQYSCFNF